MTDKQVDEIEARAVPLNGAPKDDIMSLIDEVRKLRRAIRQNSVYRSYGFPNMGKTVMARWAQEILNESS